MKHKDATAQAAKPTMAEQADIHELYELSVQNVEHEVEFLQTTFRRFADGRPTVARRFLRHRQRGLPVGKAGRGLPGDWRRHRCGSSSTGDGKIASESCPRAIRRASADRIRCHDGRNAAGRHRRGLQFQLSSFQNTRQLAQLFQRAHAALKDDGVFFVDMFGGSEAQEETKEKTKHKGFTYVWHQANFIRSRISCAATFTSSFRTARSSRRPSPTNGGCGRRPKFANCCWRRVSERRRSTGRVRMRTARATANLPREEG